LTPFRFPLAYPVIFGLSEGEATKEGIPGGGHGAFPL
jgi:hypothetical protein